MKRILLAAMASIALLISSCGKSDDSSGDITGIWQKSLKQSMDNLRQLMIVKRNLRLFLLKIR